MTIWARRVWRYQREVIRFRKSNKDRQLNDQQKMDKQWNKTLHMYNAKDGATRTRLKTGGELMCYGWISSSCSTSSTRRVTLFTNWAIIDLCPQLIIVVVVNYESLTLSGLLFIYICINTIYQIMCALCRFPGYQITVDKPESVYTGVHDTWNIWSVCTVVKSVLSFYFIYAINWNSNIIRQRYRPIDGNRSIAYLSLVSMSTIL